MIFKSLSLTDGPLRQSARERALLSVLSDQARLSPDDGGMFTLPDSIKLSRQEQDALDRLCELGYDYRYASDEG